MLDGLCKGDHTTLPSNKMIKGHGHSIRNPGEIRGRFTELMPKIARIGTFGASPQLMSRFW